MTVKTHSKLKNIHIIINPASGKKEPILPIINEVIKDTPLKWDVSVTQQAGDCTRIVREMAKKVDAMVIYGGDGTIMEAVEGVIDTDMPLGILPGGSANVLASELGIPPDLKEACKLIFEQDFILRKVDIAKIDKRLCITRASLGLEAEFVKGADREVKKRWGFWAYSLSLPKALRNKSMTQYELTIDGEKFSEKGLTCVVTNCSSIGKNLALDKQINVSDGLLDVIVAKRANVNALAQFIATVLRKKLPHDPELVSHWQGQHISITSSRKQTFQCDGEVLGKINKLTAHILPSAINVIVPELD